MSSLSYYPEPTRYYALGWSAEAFPHVHPPSLPLTFSTDPDLQRLAPWHWVFTGTLWAPWPDILWPLWQEARQHPLPAEMFLHALTSRVSRRAERQDFWDGLCDGPLLLAWPWYFTSTNHYQPDPYEWHLTQTTTIPNPWPHWIPESLWTHMPSLGLLADALRPLTSSPLFLLEQELPAIIATSPAHWIRCHPFGWSSKAVQFLIQEAV